MKQKLRPNWRRRRREDEGLRLTVGQADKLSVIGAVTAGLASCLPGHGGCPGGVGAGELVGHTPGVGGCYKEGESVVGRQHCSSVV